MKKILILTLLLSLGAHAQKIKFYGVVQDSIGKNLTAASVVVANLQTKAFQGYSITDDKGIFEIALQPDKTYSVKVSYMGYKAIIDTLAAKKTDIFKKYTLKPDKQQLAGVEIKYEMPVEVKGDTIVYNADSFTNGNEKKLGDVMKKMPGIEVNKDGTVKVEGKEVKKVMVEGKQFFDGDSKLASKNIPASAVKKVEVLRNYNDNAQMKSFEDNDESYAINIRLKKGKKNFWFGDVTAGGGIENRYYVHPKLFYYSPKHTYNIIADANNIGEPALTWRDVFKMTGGMRRLMRKGGSSFNISANALGFSMIKNDKALESDAKLAAFNYNLNPSKKLSINGFVLGNFQKTDMLTDTQTQYVASNIAENLTEKDAQNSLTASSKFKLAYNPNQNLSIEYNLLGKYSSVDENHLSKSNIRADNNVLQNEHSYYLQHAFEVYKTLKNDNLISFSVQQSLENNKPVYEAISQDEFFSHSSLINLTSQQQFDLIQNKKINTHRLENLFEYFYIINDVSHLNLSVGNETLWQNFDSNMLQKMDNDVENELNTPVLKNNAQYTLNDLYTGLHYKLLWKKWRIRPSVNFHYYYFNDTQFQDKRVRNKFALLPQLSLQYKMKRGTGIRFNYKLTNTFSDIQKYAAGYVMSSYRNLQSGNRDLDNVYAHSFQLSYHSYSMMKFRGIWALLSYQKSLHSIRNTTEQVQTDMISKPVNIYDPDENFNANANYSKRYAYWNYNIGASANLMRYNSIINHVKQRATSLSHNYNLSISSNLDGFLNFDITYKLNFSEFDNRQRKTQYITHIPGLGLELSFFKQQLLIKTKYDYYHYQNDDKTVSNQYAFLGTELFYQKKGSKWEFSLSGTNLLNTKSINSENLSDLYLATSRYYVQPNYWLLKIAYKL